mmetsp:Transcript_4973/g.18609  ORF Transcript_4973/g.18609 Transcript_4973/m.18609 type:complete len:102 (-) Transcript_4973:4156-4461(-)
MLDMLRFEALRLAGLVSAWHSTERGVGGRPPPKSPSEERCRGRRAMSGFDVLFDGLRISLVYSPLDLALAGVLGAHETGVRGNLRLETLLIAAEDFGVELE